MTDSLRDREQGRPNILLVMSDQHAAKVSGPYGHDVVRTPHMDRLAAEGVVFDAAYCNSPICVASRMSFMTGLHVQHTGVWDNGVPLPSDVPTWAHLARRAGYDVVLSGKMHFRGLDDLHGFREQLAVDINAQTLPVIPDWSTPLPAREPWTEVKAGPGVTRETEADDQVEAAALAYLRAPERTQQPWAMVVGFVAPHPPFFAPEAYYDQYPPETLDLPDVPEGYKEQLNPVYQRMLRWRGLDKGPVSDESARRARAAYFGLVTYLDDKLGALVQALEETGQRDNTVIIYCSDHGEMLGEHGLWYKTVFFEPSVRIPLIVSYPRRFTPGRRVSAPVSTVDLTALLVDLMGAEALTPLDGHSLRPLLQDTAADWDYEVFSEYYANGSSGPWAMLRHGDDKLIYSYGEPPELYDLAADPGEMHDLAGDPAHAARLDMLTARLLARWDPAALDARIRESQRVRRAIYDDLFRYLLNKETAQA